MVIVNARSVLSNRDGGVSCFIEMLYCCQNVHYFEH